MSSNCIDMKNVKLTSQHVSDAANKVQLSHRLHPPLRVSFTDLKLSVARNKARSPLTDTPLAALPTNIMLIPLYQ